MDLDSVPMHLGVSHTIFHNEKKLVKKKLWDTIKLTVIVLLLLIIALAMHELTRYEPVVPFDCQTYSQWPVHTARHQRTAPQVPEGGWCVDSSATSTTTYSTAIQSLKQ